MLTFDAAKRTRKPMKTNQRKKRTWQFVSRFLRRLCVLATSVFCIVASIRSTVASVRVLRGTRNPPLKFEAYETTNLIKFMGSGPVSQSPLVLQVLKNDTTPRNYSLYFDDDGTISPTGCKTPKFPRDVYSDLFMRVAIRVLIQDTVMQFAELRNLELIQPLVDCSFPPIKSGMNTIMRMYYLVRLRSDPRVVALYPVRFSMQNYRIADQNEEGPIGLATYTGIFDMRQPNTTYRFAGALGYPFESVRFYPYMNNGLNDEGWWSLTSVSANPLVQAQHEAVTARRTGFFVNSDSEQSNTKNLHWEYNDDPVSAITKWNWKGEPVLRDSWAWVHFVHAYFAFYDIVNLWILFLVIFRNFQRGKIWIGDAFVSISTTLLLRGPVIILTWRMNGYWTLMELCLRDAHHLAGTQEIFFHPHIMYADMLTIHLAVSTLAGYLFKERIDPIVAVLAFELGWSMRLSIVSKFPAILKYIKAYAERDDAAAILSVSQTVSAYTPMRTRTTHSLPPTSARFISSCLFPVFSTGLVVLTWIVLRKIYRRFNPDVMHVARNTTSTPGGQSVVSGTHESDALTYKRSLTIFELATGAALESHFGVISDFDNYLVIKGMKYASADGIYSNGFVIVNGKSLVATADLLSVVVMKAMRVRFRNVYTFEIDGSTVQRTARLVYPETFAWRDLLFLNITVLS